MPTLDKDWLQYYPTALVRALASVARQRGVGFYICGGPVRDWLQGRKGNDIDISTERDAADCAKALAGTLGGKYLLLDEEEDVARVVWQGISIDFSGFREGAGSISEDLGKRDFTFNAMAVSLETASDDQAGLKKPYEIIDPTNGIQDLRNGIIRCTSTAVFTKDPLRLLRAYRFMTMPGFRIEAVTEEEIGRSSFLLDRVSAERLSSELGLIMESDRAAEIIFRMVGSGVLQQLFPDLFRGRGMEQPDSHHLDVFDHSLATVQHMEDIQSSPEKYYPGHEDKISSYLAEGKRRVWLKWAALFHDLGKPDTRRIREDRDGRITFYNHDQAGARQFEKIAQRFRWSRVDTKKVSSLISMHMWPFHLSNVRKQSGLSPRACLRLAKAAGPELPGLFLLAMADSLAGKGQGRPESMEENLAGLYDEVEELYNDSVRPVLTAPRLLNGHDLIDLFALSPGTIIGRILNELEKAQVDGKVRNREEALDWVRKYLVDREAGGK